jgi:hypothetical protein
MELFHGAGTAFYRELLTRPKAAKVVARWFMKTHLLPYLSIGWEIAKEARERGPTA